MPRSRLRIGLCPWDIPKGGPGVRYYIQDSSKLSTWATDSTNWLTCNALNLTNAVPGRVAIGFWRTVWQL